MATSQASERAAQRFMNKSEESIPDTIKALSGDLNGPGQDGDFCCTIKEYWVHFVEIRMMLSTTHSLHRKLKQSASEYQALTIYRGISRYYSKRQSAEVAGPCTSQSPQPGLRIHLVGLKLLCCLRLASGVSRGKT